MERIKPKVHLEILRRANARLVQFLDQFSGSAALGTDQEVEALLRVEETLQSVGELLAEGLQCSDDLKLREEFLRYRDHLVSLLRGLSRMQGSAMACRARLYAHQEHLHAVKAWCVAARQTN